MVPVGISRLNISHAQVSKRRTTFQPMFDFDKVIVYSALKALPFRRIPEIDPEDFCINTIVQTTILQLSSRP